MGETVLEINDFSKVYDGEVNAVKNVTLSVEAGEIYGFIGHNGAGKSTTIKSVVGILPVRSGDIRIMGNSIITKKKDCQELMSYIPDNPDLYEYMTGLGYLNFIADAFQISSADRTERIKKYGDLFEITEHLDNLISSFSHGMKQKVALIGALIHQPKLLVLDEPFVGLDPKASATLKACMRELCDNGGAIFFSTHVLEVAEQLCDKVGMMDHGELIVTGKVAELTQNMTLEEVFLANLQG